MNAANEEARLRRLARRHGLQVCKSRYRNPEARRAGGEGYLVADDRNCVVAGCTHYEYDLSLEALRAFLESYTARA